MQNVIVTGGAGFIGSNLCKVLFQNNFYPVIIDDLSTGFRQLAKYGDFIEGDIGDYKKMMEVFAKYKPLAVFHIAASKSVAESVENPHKYYDNNFSKTNSLLKAVVDSRIGHFIFSSTAAIFGSIQGAEKYVDEDAPTNPINPYGASKLMVERLLSDYEVAYDLKYTALRYFNVSGADPECELGEMSPHVANIFPLLLRVIDKKQDEFVIFGDDYNTKDGTCVRDYIHVTDLANAHLLVFKKQLETNQSVKINLGNGAGFSVKDVIDIFKKTTSVNFKVRVGNRRLGDSDLLIANNQFANKYLGWYPKYTSLEDHVNHAWKWHQQLKNSKNLL